MGLSFRRWRFGGTINQLGANIITHPLLAKPLIAVVLIICHAESSISPSGNSLFSFLTFSHSPAKAEASVMCGDDDDKKHDFVSNDNQ